VRVRRHSRPRSRHSITAENKGPSALAPAPRARKGPARHSGVSGALLASPILAFPASGVPVSAALHALILTVSCLRAVLVRADPTKLREMLRRRCAVSAYVHLPLQMSSMPLVQHAMAGVWLFVLRGRAFYNELLIVYRQNCRISIRRAPAGRSAGHRPPPPHPAATRARPLAAPKRKGAATVGHDAWLRGAATRRPRPPRRRLRELRQPAVVAPPAQNALEQEEAGALPHARGVVTGEERHEVDGPQNGVDVDGLQLLRRLAPAQRPLQSLRRQPLRLLSLRLLLLLLVLLMLLWLLPPGQRAPTSLG
jgi:hypothetical protein